VKAGVGEVAEGILEVNPDKDIKSLEDLVARTYDLQQCALLMQVKMKDIEIMTPNLAALWVWYAKACMWAAVFTSASGRSLSKYKHAGTKLKDTNRWISTGVFSGNPHPRLYNPGDIADRNMQTQLERLAKQVGCTFNAGEYSTTALINQCKWFMSEALLVVSFMDQYLIPGGFKKGGPGGMDPSKQRHIPLEAKRASNRLQSFGGYAGVHEYFTVLKREFGNYVTFLDNNGFNLPVAQINTAQLTQLRNQLQDQYEGNISPLASDMLTQTGEATPEASPAQKLSATQFVTYCSNLYTAFNEDADWAKFMNGSQLDVHTRVTNTLTYQYVTRPANSAMAQTTNVINGIGNQMQQVQQLGAAQLVQLNQVYAQLRQIMLSYT